MGDSTDPGMPDPGGGAAPGGGESRGNGRGSGADGSAESAELLPAELLIWAWAIRRRARLARHAYWFPLVLFGLLICGSVPFYVLRTPVTGQVSYFFPRGLSHLESQFLGANGITTSWYAAYYWLGAMLLGIVATVLWYRWRGNRIGLRTSARGYLITGLLIIALPLLIPFLAERLAPAGQPSVLYRVTPDLLVRGTFPLILIGLGLCYLAWAERSAGLAVIAAAYLALSLVVSLYNVENLYYVFGSDISHHYLFGSGISPAATFLPNVLLPALVLLLSGSGAWLVQRRQHAPAATE